MLQPRLSFETSSFSCNRLQKKGENRVYLPKEDQKITKHGGKKQEKQQQTTGGPNHTKDDRPSRSPAIQECVSCPLATCRAHSNHRREKGHTFGARWEGQTKVSIRIRDPLVMIFIYSFVYSTPRRSQIASDSPGSQCPTLFDLCWHFARDRGDQNVFTHGPNPFPFGASRSIGNPF